MIEYEIFKSFYSEEEATDLHQLLISNGIDCKLEKTRFIVDKVIAGDGLEPTILLKIKTVDFSRATQILEDYILQNITNVDPDYYLFSFSSNELIEIINKPDEWSNQDYVIAQKILAERGHSITEKELKNIKSSRFDELAKTEQEDFSWIVIGYILSLFGGIGIFLGLFLMKGKKMLPDGSKVMIYNETTRNHGRRITIISSIIIILALIGVFTGHYTYRSGNFRL